MSKGDGVENFCADRESIFEAIWNQYPRPRGKAAARRHFLKTVKSEQDYEQFCAAMNSYMKEINGRGIEFVKYGSSFFNQWRDWIPRAVLQTEHAVWHHTCVPCTLAEHKDHRPHTVQQCQGTCACEKS